MLKEDEESEIVTDKNIYFNYKMRIAKTFKKHFPKK
jgi:hypothetical protein